MKKTKPMTEQKKYRATIKALGLTDKKIAKELGISITSYKSGLQPSRPFPKWAKAIILGAKHQRKIISKQFKISSK